MHTLRTTCLALALLGSLVAGPGHAAAGVAAIPDASPGARTVIYSTFNDHKKRLYGWHTAWGAEGADVHGGTSYSVAMPFTPAADGHVQKIVLALGLYRGTNAMTVTLREDAGGLPGAAIKQVRVVDVPDAWQCCQTVAVAMKGVPVAAGTPYWVALSAEGDTEAIWYVNSLGLRGPMSLAADDAWRPVDDKLAAFSVLGD